MLVPALDRAARGAGTMLTAAALAAVLAVSACGGDEPPTPEPDAASSPSGGSTPEPADVATVPDACTLLAADEIEAVTGTAYDDGVIDEAMTSESQAVCQYDPADGGLSFVLVVVNETGAQFALQRESADEGLPTPTEDVQGLGDEAYWSADTGTVATHVGPVFVQVSLLTGVRTTVVELARAVLSNL